MMTTTMLEFEILSNGEEPSKETEQSIMNKQNNERLADLMLKKYELEAELILASLRTYEEEGLIR